MHLPLSRRSTGSSKGSLRWTSDARRRGPGCGVVDLEQDDLQGRGLALGSFGVSVPRIGVVSKTRLEHPSFKHGQSWRHVALQILWGPSK